MTGMFLTPFRSHLQIFLLIQSINAFFVHLPAFSLQKRVQPKIPVARPGCCKLFQATPQLRLLIAPVLVAKHSPADLNEHARTTLTCKVLPAQILHVLSLARRL
jgi:hypothetical protein